MHFIIPDSFRKLRQPNIVMQEPLIDKKDEVLVHRQRLLLSIVRPVLHNVQTVRLEQVLHPFI